jgi:hypothetical protein
MASIFQFRPEKLLVNIVYIFSRYNNIALDCHSGCLEAFHL